MSPFLSRQVPLEQLVGPASSKKLEHLGQIQDFLGQEHQVRMRSRPSTQDWGCCDSRQRASLNGIVLLRLEVFSTPAYCAAAG
jgi:hypothetical protein